MGLSLVPAVPFLSMESVLRPLTVALCARDPSSAIHSNRVAEISAALAKRLDPHGTLWQWMWLGGLVHDVGKIGLPDSILLNPGRLTPEEYAAVKRHPVIGEEIVDAVDGVPKIIRDIVCYHHERFDGTGYPRGCTGDEIPLPARIVAIADAWDAMTSDRVYRPAMPVEEAREEMVRCAGTQFDPELVGIFLETVIDGEIV